jgi:hypothetical protein
LAFDFAAFASAFAAVFAALFSARATLADTFDSAAGAVVAPARFATAAFAFVAFATPP